MVQTVDSFLQILEVADGHLDDLSLFDAAAAFLEVLGRDEARQVREAIVHAVATPLLDYPMRHWVLLQINTKNAISMSSYYVPNL